MAIWIATRPGTEDRWSDVPGILQDNWETYGSATSAEHGGLGSTPAGTHALCGIAGTCYYGTNTNIAALSDPPSGAIAWNQTQGLMDRYWSSSWNPTTSAEWSRMRWYLATPQSIGSVDGNTQTVGISFDSKSYDSATSEYQSGSANVAISADGNYLIYCQATMNASGSQGATSAASATNDVIAGFDHATVMYSAAPTADITRGWSSSVPHYEQIDEYTPNLADYMATASQSALDSFQVANANVPSIFDSAGVSMSGYVGPWYDPNSRTFIYCLYINNQWYPSTLQSTVYGNTAWKTYTWGTNPASLAAWTTAEINGTGSSATSISAVGICAGSTLYYGLHCYTLRLVATCVNTGDNYISIDEYPTAVDADYLSANCSTSTYATDSFRASGGFSLPTLAKNISASVYVRARRGAGSVISAGGVLVVTNTSFSGSSFQALDTAFSTYKFTWNQNPATSTDWTASSINSTLCGFGYYTSGGATTTQMDVSQAYLVVDWEQNDPTSTLEVWKNYTLAGSALLAKTVKASPIIGQNRNDAVKAMTVSQLSSGNIVTFHMTKTLVNDTITSGDDATYFCMHRLGNACL